MKHLISCCVVAGQLALVGCASAPPPPPPVRDHYPEAVQNKALVAQHWGAIAADVAVQTKATLASNNFLQDRSFYVVPASTSAFDQAFTNFMITSLVEAGLPVTLQRESAVELRYETQLIRHNVEFDPDKEGFVPGAPTTVGAQFWVLRNAESRPIPVELRGKAVEEDPKSRLRATSVEMLISTSVIDSDQYLQRSTDAYYIEKADAELFEVKPVEAKSRVYREWKVDSK